MENQKNGRHERIANLGWDWITSNGFEEKVDSPTYFHEFWSSLCPIWIQSSLFESFWTQTQLFWSWCYQMGQIYRKIWSVWNKVLKKKTKPARKKFLVFNKRRRKNEIITKSLTLIVKLIIDNWAMFQVSWVFRIYLRQAALSRNCAYCFLFHFFTKLTRDFHFKGQTISKGAVHEGRHNFFPMSDPSLPHVVDHHAGKVRNFQLSKHMIWRSLPVKNGWKSKL